MSKQSDSPRKGTVKLKSNVEVFYPPQLYRNSTPDTSNTSKTSNTSNTFNTSDTLRSDSAPPKTAASSSTQQPDSQSSGNAVKQSVALKSGVSVYYPKSLYPNAKGSPEVIDLTDSIDQSITTRTHYDVGTAIRSGDESSTRSRNEPSNITINQSSKEQPVETDDDIPAAMAELGWVIVKNIKTGKQYYFNEKTKKVSYTWPEEFEEGHESPVYSGSDFETPAGKIFRRTPAPKRILAPSAGNLNSEHGQKPTAFFESAVEMDVDMDATDSINSLNSLNSINSVNSVGSVNSVSLGGSVGSVVPMEVDTVKDLRLHEDYLGAIPPVHFDIPDVEMSSAEAEQPKKCLILDTNIIVGDGGKTWTEFLEFVTTKAPHLTRDVQIRIPHMVLLELDKLKAKRGTPVSWAANRACRDINDRFRAKDRRFVGQTVSEYQKSKTIFSPKNNDDCILACCLQAQKDFPTSVFFVTDDVMLQTRALIQENGIQVMNGAALRFALQPKHTEHTEHNEHTEHTEHNEHVEHESGRHLSVSEESVAAATACRRLSECVDDLLLKILSDFLIQRLIQIYGRFLWRDIIKGSLPPWHSASEVVSLIQKHQSALFLDVFQKRSDVEIFTVLLSSSVWTFIRSPVEEMNRLSDCLKKASVCVEYISQLEKSVTATYRGALSAAGVMLQRWETTRFLVERNQVPFLRLEEEVAEFLAHKPDLT